MGFSGKGKNSNEGWGLGLLLVFFPEEEDKYTDKKKKLSSASSSSFKSTTNSGSSNTNLLSSKAQSTISICALFVFFTLLLFTLCTFEPNVSTNPSSSTKIELGFPRRWLSEKNYNKDGKNKGKRFSSSSSSSSSMSLALQGMGTLFRRGTRGMSDLIVAHLMEDTTDDEIRLFLRTLHGSGLTSTADIVFIFPSPIVSSNFSTIIQQENESFLKLVHNYRNRINDSSTINGFDVTQFVKSDEKEKQGGGEPLWGRRIIHSNYSNPDEEEEKTELNELSWGSVVGFEASELDPEDSLSGFLDHVPIRLRRWACYPMLLGRVRRNFKHLMLVDVKDVVVLGDPLVRVRNRNTESVYLWTIDNKKHGRRNSEKNHSHNNNNKKETKSMTGDVIMGGIRGIRRLSNAMLNEIVRAAILIQHKTKNSVSDSAILSQLSRNESLLKNVNINIVTSESSIPDMSSLVGANWSSSLLLVHRGGNRNVDFNSILVRGICSSTLDSSSVYRDCLVKEEI